MYIDNEVKSFKTFTDEVSCKRKITNDRIKDLYGICLLKESDFDSEGLTCNFRVGEGYFGDVVFSVDRLNAHREELDYYIGQLSDIDHAPSFSKLSFTENGEEWAESSEVVDMLVQMGTASSMLFFTMPSQLWPYLPNGIPFVGKQIYDNKSTIVGCKAEEYTKRYGKK